MQGNWSYPTEIRFGAGRLSELGDACRVAGIDRPLLVTDRGLAKQDITERALGFLRAAGFEAACFTHVDPNPDEFNLEMGIASFRNGHHDGIVAFGGGSGLDIGKLIAFIAGQERPIWDFEDVDDWWTRANPDVIAPIVAVPTTAGTGSEVGRASVVTNSVSHEKKIIFHPKMLPSVVICDPELTIGMPPAITAGTGMDAFAHCLEAYSSPHFHPFSQGIALEGMRLIKENLIRAYTTPDDLQARGQMMAAASMGAIAFQKGLGAIHAISHPIGAVHNTHHGTTNAVVMSQVLAFNRPAIEDQIERAGNYLDVRGGFDGFLDFVTDLNQRLGIPNTLRALGVTSPDLDVLVDMVLRDPSVGGNPVEMTPENTRALIEQCL